jgi:cell fate regulator YaaT (PSP1 superfamily)
MARLHLIRVGAMGQIGRFATIDSTRYPRGTRVIVRSVRGLEVGEVLAAPAEDDDAVKSDGALLRGMTVEDQLLEARLSKNRQSAFDACRARLDELGLSAPLLDVEHLFDGKTLVFYFLGDQPPEADGLIADLADIYETKVSFRSFADALTNGCGPDCGTEAAGGNCGSCATGCALSSACSTRKQ